jgi:hypothetical protein
MFWLTEDAVLVCMHEMGRVSIEATQTLVTIMGRRVLVHPNPEGREINGCPNVVPPMRACVTTLVVRTGYSPFMRIEEEQLCLDSVRGLTDGTPPGFVEYKVRHAGQDLVSEVA